MKKSKPPIHVESATALVAECDASEFSAADISNAMGFSEPVGETTNAALERTIKEEWEDRVLPWARRQLAEDEKRILEGELGHGEPVGFLTRPGRHLTSEPPA